MAGPMYGQSQFKEYGADPGKYLLQGMQVGSQMRKNEADTAMTNQYKNQLVDESKQKMGIQQREDDPARMQNLMLGLAAVTTDDPKVRMRASELLHGSLPPEEQQRFGDYKNWTKAEMTNVLAKSLTGKDFAPFLNFLSRDAENQTKVDISDKKLTGKAALKDPKYSQAWMQLSKTVRPSDINDARKSFNELRKQGVDPFEAATQVGDALSQVRQDYIKNIKPLEEENEKLKGKWFGDKTQKALPKKKTAYEILFSGEGEGVSVRGGAMSETAARKALADKGISGPDADNWISQYKQAGKVR